MLTFFDNFDFGTNFCHLRIPFNLVLKNNPYFVHPRLIRHNQSHGTADILYFFVTNVCQESCFCEEPTFKNCISCSMLLIPYSLPTN